MLAIVEVNPEYGPQLNIKMFVELIPIKRRSYKTSTSELASENDEEEIDASAWIQSKVDEDEEDDWDSDESDESDEESDDESDEDEVEIEEVDDNDNGLRQ